jgi:hypothetical protein
MLKKSSIAPFSPILLDVELLEDELKHFIYTLPSLSNSNEVPIKQFQ